MPPHLAPGSGATAPTAKGEAFFDSVREPASGLPLCIGCHTSADCPQHVPLTASFADTMKAIQSRFTEMASGKAVRNIEGWQGIWRASTYPAPRACTATSAA